MKIIHKEKEYDVIIALHVIKEESSITNTIQVVHPHRLGYYGNLCSMINGFDKIQMSNYQIYVYYIGSSDIIFRWHNESFYRISSLDIDSPLNEMIVHLLDICAAKT